MFRTFFHHVFLGGDEMHMPEVSRAQTGRSLRAKLIRTKAQGQRPVSLTVIVAGASIFLLWLAFSPLIMLLWGSFRSAGPGAPGAYFTVENYVRAFSEPFIYAVLGDTLIFTLGSVCVALFVGVTSAWLVERTNIYLRNAIFVLFS